MSKQVSTMKVLIWDPEHVAEQKLVRWDKDKHFHRATLQRLQSVDRDDVEEGAQLEMPDPGGRTKYTQVAIFACPYTEHQAHQLLSAGDMWIRELPHLEPVPRDVSTEDFERRGDVGAATMVLAKHSLDEWLPAVVLKYIRSYLTPKNVPSLYLVRYLQPDVTLSEAQMLQAYVDFEAFYVRRETPPLLRSRRLSTKEMTAEESNQISDELFVASTYEEQSQRKLEEVWILSRDRLRRMHSGSPFKLDGEGNAVFPDTRAMEPGAESGPSHRQGRRS